MRSEHHTAPVHRRGLVPSTLGLGAALALAGCTVGPYTGTMLTTEPSNTSLLFFGMTDTKSKPVTVYVLGNANADIHVASSWIPFTSTTTSATPNQGGDTVPYYSWQKLSPFLDSTKFPRGGLARFKVKSVFNGSTTPQWMFTFDNEGNACLNAQPPGTPWRARGNECRSPYADDQIITVVSTVTTPAEEYVDVPYLARGGDHSLVIPTAPTELDDASFNYYESIGAPFTLTDFKETYGFPTGEVHAIYYNQGDLGIARDMHCRKFPIQGVQGVACYVGNYGRRLREPFGTEVRFGDLDPQVALEQAIAAHELGDVTPEDGLLFPAATVAMVYNPTIPATDNRIQFMVYDSGGNLDVFAPLDNHGVSAAAFKDADTLSNINVPDNCLACHGISSDYDRKLTGHATITDTAFLPFDPEAFLYSDTSATYSEQSTIDAIEELNKLVWDTSPPAGVVELLKGMYGGLPQGPKSAGAEFTPDYVPAAWSSGGEAGTQVYNEVVKPYCRSCHVSATLPYFDFDSWTEFQGFQEGIRATVCDPNGPIAPMPHAEQTQTRFWKSPASAHLVNALGISDACAP